MAVFPDRIVLKNSKDGDAAVADAIKNNGTDPIVSGEVVLSQGNGRATMYTLDANGTVVPIGVTPVDASIEPAIILNFEEDGTDTPITTSVQTTFPSPDAAKWGNAGFRANNTRDNSPRLDSITIDRANMPFLAQDPWTVEFWYKGDPADWDDVNVGNNLPQNPQAIVTSQGYVFGPGAFCIYLDPGTVDMIGGGITTTSETEGQAFGSVVLGISPNISIPGTPNDWSEFYLPPTGEIVSTRSQGVVDNQWHHVAISHEGLGKYTAYVDGELCQRVTLPNPIDYLNAGNSGLTLPVGLTFGGVTYDPADLAPGVLRGFNGSLDAFVMYQGLAKYKGLFGFAVPGGPPDSTPIPQISNTLERLEDVDIPPSSQIADLSVLAYNANTGLWEDRASLPYDITGNSLGDLGDVVIETPVAIADGEVLAWNDVDNQWENRQLSLSSVGDVLPNPPLLNQYLYYNGNAWEPAYIQYDHISGRPVNLSDLEDDVGLNGLFDVNVDVDNLANNDVLRWDDPSGKWVAASAPPADLTNNKLWELDDVDVNSNPGAIADGQFLRWNGDSDKWQASSFNYDDLDNAPTRVSDLVRDVNVSYWPNDSNYINPTNAFNYSIDIFGDINIDETTLDNGQMLIYRNNEWINEFGPPANIAFNSIGDLGDVTYVGASAIDPGTLTVESMGTLAFDDPGTSSNLEQHVTVDREYGLGITSQRDFDQSGTAIYADRGRGVTLRSDVNYVRLTGVPTVNTNRPELRFETGDSGGDNPFGEYIGLKMPPQVDESVTYLLPPADGDTGDILATDGFGRLSWIAQAAEGSLSELQDVDLATVPPSNGDILVYNEAAGLWVVGQNGTSDVESIDDLSDVITSGAQAPQNGQALIWDDQQNQWVPGDVQSEEAAPAMIWNVTAVDSNQYIFSGPGFTGFVGNPTLYVVRGQKYTFRKDVGAHPFQLQTTPGLGQSPYIDGVVGTVPLPIGDLEWTVQMDAPNKLYYQCTAHSSMQGEIIVLSDENTAGANLTVLAKDGASGTPIGQATEVSKLSFNAGNGFSVTDLGNGEAFVELGSSFAPWYVDGQDTLSPAGEEPIKFIAGSGIEITTNPNATIKEITFTSTGGGGGGGGAGGALDAGRATETQTADASGYITFSDLGHNGTFIDITSTVDAWITFYVNSSSRAADAGRSYGTDPALQSGVVAEFFVPAGTTVLATPGTSYYNADTFQVEALYAACRDQQGTVVTPDVTVRTYAGKTYTAISGGTFGSG